MLNTAELKAGDRCLYKTLTLVFEKTASIKGTKYHVFRTQKGTQKKISEAIAQKDVWLEM